MYICIRICINVYIYTHTHTHTCICIHVYIVGFICTYLSLSNLSASVQQFFAIFISIHKKKVLLSPPNIARFIFFPYIYTTYMYVYMYVYIYITYNV